MNRASDLYDQLCTINQLHNEFALAYERYRATQENVALYYSFSSFAKNWIVTAASRLRNDGVGSVFAASASHSNFI